MLGNNNNIIQETLKGPVTYTLFGIPVTRHCGHTLELATYLNIFKVAATADSEEGQRPKCPECRATLESSYVPTYLILKLLKVAHFSEPRFFHINYVTDNRLKNFGIDIATKNLHLKNVEDVYDTLNQLLVHHDGFKCFLEILNKNKDLLSEKVFIQALCKIKKSDDGKDTLLPPIYYLDVWDNLGGLKILDQILQKTPDIAKDSDFIQAVCATCNDNASRQKNTSLLFFLASYSEPLGRKILLKLLELNPELAKDNRFIEALIVVLENRLPNTTSQNTTALFWLSTLDATGRKVIHKLVENNPNIAKNEKFIQAVCKVLTKNLNKCMPNTSIFYILSACSDDLGRIILYNMLENNPKIAKKPEFIRALCTVQTGALGKIGRDTSSISWLLIDKPGQKVLLQVLKNNPYIANKQIFVHALFKSYRKNFAHNSKIISPIWNLIKLDKQSEIRKDILAALSKNPFLRSTIEGKNLYYPFVATRLRSSNISGGIAHRTPLQEMKFEKPHSKKPKLTSLKRFNQVSTSNTLENVDNNKKKAKNHHKSDSCSSKPTLFSSSNGKDTTSIENIHTQPHL